MGFHARSNGGALKGYVRGTPLSHLDFAKMLHAGTQVERGLACKPEQKRGYQAGGGNLMGPPQLLATPGDLRRGEATKSETLLALSHRIPSLVIFKFDSIEYLFPHRSR